MHQINKIHTKVINMKFKVKIYEIKKLNIDLRNPYKNGQSKIFKFNTNTNFLKTPINP